MIGFPSNRKSIRFQESVILKHYSSFILLILKMRKYLLKVSQKMIEQGLGTLFRNLLHFMKSVSIWSRSGSYCPAFGLNTETCVQSKCGKIQTRKTPNTNTFHAVLLLSFIRLIWCFFQNKWLYLMCLENLLP